MALLIFFNLLFTDGMEAWHRAVRRGQDATDLVASANIHAYVGIAILVLAALRLILRYTQGVPDMPAEEPAILKLVAKATHVLIYLLLFAMPLTGIGAYYFGINVSGDIHADYLKVVLWAVIVLHVLGALVQKFYFKSDVLDRMTKGVKA